MADRTLLDAASHLPALRRYARALTRDDTSANDLVQQALLRACERASTYRPDHSLQTWLLAILHNEFVSGRRREAAERRRNEGFATLQIRSSGADEQEQAVYLRQTAERFDSLPGPQRAVLHLIAVEGLSYGEAATALGLPIGTVMSRLSRARAALRDPETPIEERRPFRVIRGNDAS